MSTYYVPGIILQSGAWEGAKEKFPALGDRLSRVNVVFFDSHRTLGARVISSVTNGESGSQKGQGVCPEYTASGRHRGLLPKQDSPLGSPRSALTVP